MKDLLQNAKLADVVTDLCCIHDIEQVLAEMGKFIDSQPEWQGVKNLRIALQMAEQEARKIGA